MHVAMIGLKGLPGTFGGVERHVEELGAALVARGHEVTAYVRRHYTPEAIDVRGIQTLLRPTIHTKHLDATIHTILSALHAGKQDYDLVHFHAIGPASFAWLTRMRGMPVIATIHSLDYLRDKWGAFAKWYLRRAERRTLKYADRVICVSESIARRHVNEATPVVHIPNGVAIPTIRPPHLIAEQWGLRGGDYVLYAGRLSPEKGVHHLVRAYHRVVSKRKLIIAGGTSHTDDYVRMLQRDADARTLFVGYQEGEALAELFSNAAAFVLPSDHEGMPVALLEAWSYGLPCLVSNIEACCEIADKEGEFCIFFNQGDSDHLAVKLERLLADPRAIAMGETARRHVINNYGWEKIARQVERQYHLVLEGRR